MTPQQYCRDKAAASGSSFYYAFRFLAPAKRRAITAFYSFCREVDDVVDDCRDAGVARIKLEWWRQELDRAYGGQPSHPVARALREFVGPFNLPHAQMEAIIDGMIMDLGPVRYSDFESLQLYCHRVAGVVGEISARIFGHSEPATLDYAARLGLAFQLTNIIRDVGEDARRDRIYLPQDEMARFGVSTQDILQGRDSAAFRHLLEFQYQRARATYNQALARLPAADRKAQRPGLIMAAIYQALLEEIRLAGYPVLRCRIAIPPGRQFWLAVKTWLSGRA